MKLSKKKIEQLAVEIRQFLLDNQLWQDVTIYYNKKAFSTSDGNGNYAYNDPQRLYELEDKNPGDYFEYVAKPHILSMSFEGPLCGCLNFYNEHGAEFDNRIINGFSAILSGYGLFYELGEHWNLSCYPLHNDSPPQKPAKKADGPIMFRADRTWPEHAIIPNTLLRIQNVWKEKADAYGDVGSCVLGAGFHFTFEGKRYIMPPTSRWQGSVSWEHFVPEIQAMLEEAGATSIRFEYGDMD